MMHMTLYWGIKVTILFDSWKTTNWLGYILTLLALFLISTFYQYMEDRRHRFKSLSSAKPSPAPSAVTPLLVKSSRASSARFATAVLFGVNSAIGYMLMLAIMSFNGGVFLVVVLGLSVGYYLFRSAEEEEVAVVADNTCACA
ncbi:hypothetical protein Ddye_020400 [Dipteronia dyeriana]|uniref:Copper transport protein n=1 Tax=Dipteronia dyeriana TaxID=168575 RepID=A0AAD9U0Q7_9ROSI|nr:hypothetical protein Ddye_020400 [Dipteronia dyeriana]